MYITKLRDKNIGPLQNVLVDFPFSETGNPKPIIFVGENGSGKSTLLSNIVDAFYCLADMHYENAMVRSDDSEGKQYYKAINPVEIHTGCRHMYSYIQFDDTKPIHYIFKSGKITADEFRNEVSLDSSILIEWENSNFKDIQADKKAVERIFKKDVICYLGPDRYEKPMWMGSQYVDNKHAHPSVKCNWNGILQKPITIKNVNEDNLQWLLDVIVDSRMDFAGTVENLQPTNSGAFILSLEARHNVEVILSQILGRKIRFDLNIRTSGASRFKIIDADSGEVVTPTLDSLSTGQIALFNMFTSIVRYADISNINNSVTVENITGIVVIDEIELHLHTTLQKEVLPRLIQLFPKVQFVITTHSPLFLLGMQDIFGENGYEIYEMPTATRISVERFSEFQRAYDYFKNTETYQKDAQNAIISVMPAKKVLVITEGATDWKHMKVAMDVLRQKEEHATLFDALEFEFFEYEPINGTDEAVHKLQMGNSVLSSICENICKMPQDVIRIFIADRDDDKTNTKMGGKERNYKSWGNSTYSFLLPIPSSRADTPAISIEHLFSDAEIKTEILCDDGISRRLYMGNEFDEYGHAQAMDRFCERKDLCGPNKINVIEGSQGDRIHSFSNTDKINNYALSKMNFAKHVMAHPECFNFDNFVEIFKIIKAIIEEENGNA